MAQPSEHKINHHKHRRLSLPCSLTVCVSVPWDPWACFWKAKSLTTTSHPMLGYCAHCGPSAGSLIWGMECSPGCWPGIWESRWLVKLIWKLFGTTIVNGARNSPEVRPVATGFSFIYTSTFWAPKPPGPLGESRLDSSSGLTEYMPHKLFHLWLEYWRTRLYV